ncbi:hypothetical protein KEJ47_09575 [Candidatus Bathyarchaeota archaeon]|nr:hypothetical protein [Candidatus Bathyarchaeota archaeon]
MNFRKLMVFATLVAILALPLAGVSAATDMDLTWSGPGSVSGTFTSGDDAVVGMYADGWTHGQFHATDADDNPYNYQVDTTSAWFKGYIDDGGELYFDFDRRDSHESMYGPADQRTESYLGSSGTGQLIFRTRSNYADLDSSNYNFQNNDHFLATGEYYAYHNVYNGNNWAGFMAAGNGTLDIDHMTDDTWVTTIKFGHGCGCYTNADVVQTGAGEFNLGAHFEDGMQMDGWSASGEVDYSFHVGFTSGFSWSDYHFTGN